jgi:hypothetical protein
LPPQLPITDTEIWAVPNDSHLSFEPILWPISLLLRPTLKTMLSLRISLPIWFCTTRVGGNDKTSLDSSVQPENSCSGEGIGTSHQPLQPGYNPEQEALETVVALRQKQMDTGELPASFPVRSELGYYQRTSPNRAHLFLAELDPTCRPKAIVEFRP